VLLERLGGSSRGARRRSSRGARAAARADRGACTPRCCNEELLARRQP
jgi:hypothetical protein